MLRRAVVTKIIDRHMAEVSVRRQSACGEKCVLCGACAQGNEIRALAKNSAQAAPGDAVVLQAAGGKVFAAAFMVYLLPLFLFFVFFAAAFMLGAGEGMSALAACAGFLAGIPGAALYNRRVKKSGGASFEIVKKI